jgi:hypothetical protein
MATEHRLSPAGPSLSASHHCPVTSKPLAWLASLSNLGNARVQRPSELAHAASRLCTSPSTYMHLARSPVQCVHDLQAVYVRVLCSVRKTCRLCAASVSCTAVTYPHTHEACSSLCWRRVYTQHSTEAAPVPSMHPVCVVGTQCLCLKARTVHIMPTPQGTARVGAHTAGCSACCC